MIKQKETQQIVDEFYAPVGEWKKETTVVELNKEIAETLDWMNELPKGEAMQVEVFYMGGARLVKAFNDDFIVKLIVQKIEGGVR